MNATEPPSELMPHLSHPIANDSPDDIERVERNIQSTIDTVWSHGPADCQAENLSME